MKNQIILALFLLFVGNVIFAGNNEPNPSSASEPTNELIVSFEKLSSKQYQDLDNALSGINGIRKIGSCERMNVFYFTYDESIYRSAEEAFDALIVKTKVYQPLMKIGASITSVKSNC